MIDKIIINSSRNEALFWFTSGRRFIISTDNNDLIDLIVFFTSDFKSVAHITEHCERIESSKEDTQTIDLSQYETLKAA